MIGKAREKAAVSPKRAAIRIIAVALACLAAFAASRFLREREETSNADRRELTFAPMVADGNAALAAFRERFPERNVVLACEEDVTNDALPDLLVIYTEGDLTRFVTAIAGANGDRYTEPIPAPVENQGIQFKNIDKKDEMEFIISGEKKGAAGYAIYRIIDGQPKDLFGDGMNDCC